MTEKAVAEPRGRYPMTIPIDPSLTKLAYIHEQEVRDAVRAINLTAVGGNSFSEAPFEKLKPGQRDSVLQALCVVVSALAQKSNVGEAPLAQAEKPKASAIGNQPLDKYLEQIEREEIIVALKESKYNRTAAARRLGITLRALRYRLERLGMGAGNDEQ